MTLDQHLQIQARLFGQGSGRKGFLPHNEPPSLLPGHHPALAPVSEDLLTTCYLWGAMPTPQNTELSVSTKSKALAEAAEKEMI